MIPEEGLVTPRPVENHRDPGIARGLHQLPVGVRAGGVKRLVHIPEQVVEVFEQIALVGPDLLVARACHLRHALRVPAFVDTGVPTTRGERVGRGRAVLAAEDTGECGHGGGVEAPGEQGSDGHVAS